jgi:hypothetical protein
MQEQIQNPNALFTGPIPGASLTTERGNRPWENPPKESDLDKVINTYIRRLQSPEIIRPIMDAIRYGTSITTIVESVIETAVMEGEHSLDIGILASPVIVEYLKQMAEAGQIDYKLTADDVRADKKVEKIDGRLLEKVLSELDEPSIKEESIKEPDEKKGLMSKRGAKE